MKRLAQEINSDKDLKMTAYESIKQELDSELAKPLKKRDFDKIAELTAQYRELVTGESGDSLTERGIDKLNKKIDEYEKKHFLPIFSSMKRLTPVLCAVVIMLVGNCVTVAAWDMNILSAIVKFTKGGFSVDFTEEQQQQDIVELPTSENDPYGISEECAKYDVYPTEIPTYIPEGFNLTYTTHNVNPDYANFVSFTFENGKKTISIDYTRYWNEVGNDIIPSDDYNISKMDINGSEAIVSKEDKEYIITYIKGKTVFYMYAKNVDYDECDKIVESIK